MGRDVLYGVALGIFFCDLYCVRYHLEGRLGALRRSRAPIISGSFRFAFGAWLFHVPGSIAFTLLLFLILFLFRVLFRKSWLAAAAFVLLFTALKSASSDYPAVEWPMEAILYTVLAAGSIAFWTCGIRGHLFTVDLSLNIPVDTKSIDTGISPTPPWRSPASPRSQSGVSTSPGGRSSLEERIVISRDLARAWRHQARTPAKSPAHVQPLGLAPSYSGGVRFWHSNQNSVKFSARAVDLAAIDYMLATSILAIWLSRNWSKLNSRNGRLCMRHVVAAVVFIPLCLGSVWPD